MPVNNLTAPMIDSSQSVVLNATALVVYWTAVEGVSSYGVAVDRVVERVGQSNTLVRVVRISVSVNRV